MSSESSLADPTHPALKWAAVPVALVRRAIHADDLLHHGGVMAAATVVSGGFNYLYQVFMGRALGPEQFGVFGALFALLYLATVLGRGIRFSASRFVAEFDPADPALPGYYRGLLLRSLAFGTIVFGAIAVAAPAVADFLDVESSGPVLIVAAAVPASLAFTANKGTLQGLQWFTPLGGYQILLAVVKLAAGVGLVLLGYGVAGALGAIVIASSAVLIASTLHLRLRFPTSIGTVRSHDYAPAYRYVLPAVLAGFCLTVPGTVDVIVVQHFSPGREAGLYTAVSVLGKVLVFLPLGICAALFPKVSDGHVESDRARLSRLLWRGLGYAGIVAGGGAFFYVLLPELVLSLFFGPDYTAAAALLRWYGVAVFVFVLAIVILNFELARDRTRYVYLFTAGSIVEIALLWAVDGSPVGMAQVILVVNAALFGYGLYEVRR